MSAVLLALWLAQAVCVSSALTQSVTPSSFQEVTPGTTQLVDILIENHNPAGCPASAVILSAEAAAPFTWPVAVEGGAKRVIDAGTHVFARLHIAVPAEATTGSVVVAYTLEHGGEPFVVPIVVNVQRP